jgi:hypothetical protein
LHELLVLKQSCIACLNRFFVIEDKRGKWCLLFPSIECSLDTKLNVNPIQEQIVPNHTRKNISNRTFYLIETSKKNTS